MEKVAAGGRKSYGVSGGGAKGDYDCFCFFPTSRRRRRLCGALSDRTIDFRTLYGHVWGIKPVPEYGSAENRAAGETVCYTIWDGCAVIP